MGKLSQIHQREVSHFEVFHLVELEIHILSVLWILGLHFEELRCSTNSQNQRKIHKLWKCDDPSDFLIHLRDVIQEGPTVCVCVKFC